MSRPVKESTDSAIAPYVPITDADKEAVCRALGSCPTISAAIRQAFGDDRRASAIYSAIRNDPIEFGAAVEHAKESYRDLIRSEIYRRGVLGVEKPLSYQGCLTGHSVVEYSDEMLKAAARLALPDEWLDKRSSSDLHVDIAAVTEAPPPGTFQITDAEALTLSPEGYAALTVALREIAKKRRQLAREQSAVAALSGTVDAIDAEFTELDADEARELAELL